MRARRAAVARAEQALEREHRGERACIVDLDHVIGELEREARLHARPADAFDDRRLLRARVAIAAAPALGERRAARLGDRQPRRVAGPAQVAADRRGRAPRAGAAHDPVRLDGARVELREDRFGDVVVRAPVGRAFGQAELVQVARTRSGVRSRDVDDRARIRDQLDVAAEPAHARDLVGRRAGRHDGRERTSEQAREPGLRDRGAAGRGIHHALARCEPAVAERVEEQRAREAVLEAARRMRGLVLEVERHARIRRERQCAQRRVGRARGLVVQRGHRVGDELARRVHAATGAASSASTACSSHSK